MGIGSITVTATQEAWGDYLETSVSYSLDITPTGIEESEIDNINIYGTFGSIVIIGIDNAKVEIFGMSGALINSTMINGETSISTNSGVYIVKVTDVNGNSKVTRVIVK